MNERQERAGALAQGQQKAGEGAAPPEREAPRCPPGGVELTQGDDLWPPGANDMKNAPRVLCVLGDPSALLDPCISIVGSRRPTPYGVAIAELAGRISAECGITVVSGGARGSDSIAARAALDAGGRTVVVPGCGADVVYPDSSRDVFTRAIAGEGCVVSMEAWGMRPTRFTFPKRNVLIAALSRATLVCEAGMPSGTISTAEAAMEMGRTLLSVPGSIFSPWSRGSNRLIVDGAIPITDEAGLEQAISMEYNVLRLLRLDGVPDRGRLLSALVANPMRPDELAARLDIQMPRLLALISRYEMNGLVCRLPDGRYSPTERAYLARTIALDG